MLAVQEKERPLEEQEVNNPEGCLALNRQEKHAGVSFRYDFLHVTLISY